MHARLGVIVIGGSAGAIDAMLRIVVALPPDLPARVFLTIHVPCHAISALPTILARTGPLLARHPCDGERTDRGVIYVAPPDYHLVVQRGLVRLDQGARESGHRPAIDVLFRSAASAYGADVIGVILSGNLDDGAAGCRAIAAAGGRVLVQHPSEAAFPSMPRHSIASTSSALSLPLLDIPDRLVTMLGSPPDGAAWISSPSRVRPSPPLRQAGQGHASPSTAGGPLPEDERAD